MKPNQHGARDDAPNGPGGGAADTERGAADTNEAPAPPPPPVSMPPTGGSPPQPSYRSQGLPAPPPAPLPPTTGPVPAPGVTGPLPAPQGVALVDDSHKTWRMALIAINIIALLITAVAITLLLTNNRSESASATTAGQTSTNATTTAPATTAQAPATTAPAPTPAPATPAPATPAPTAAPRPPPTPAPTTQRPAPDPLLPSTDEVHHLAKDTIEGFLQADNDNQVDVAIGYLLPPVDEWVDEGSLSESGLRDNIGGDKSSDVWLTLASDITVLSGPAAGGPGEWTATVGYNLGATGNYVSKDGETKCVDNVVAYVDKIVGYEDGGRIKSHKKTKVVSDSCND